MTLTDLTPDPEGIDGRRVLVVGLVVLGCAALLALLARRWERGAHAAAQSAHRDAARVQLYRNEIESALIEAEAEAETIHQGEQHAARPEVDHAPAEPAGS